MQAAIAVPHLATWVQFVILMVSILSVAALMRWADVIPERVSRARILGGIVAVLAVLILAQGVSATVKKPTVNVIIPCTDWGCIIDSIFW